MEVLYKSTRGNGETVTASQAILKGLSDDGGLFVPTSIPALDVPMEKLAAMSYQEVAYEEIGRASCRERVWISVVDASLQKKANEV